jgi:hypothetical protein
MGNNSPSTPGCILPIPALLLSINPTSPVPPNEIVPLTIAGYALPLCTNVMVTGLIAGRIWYISRIIAVDEHGKPVIKRVAAGERSMMLIIESGALYLVTQLIFVILVATQNPAEAVLSLAGTQIYVSPRILWFVVHLNPNICFRRLLPA